MPLFKVRDSDSQVNAMAQYFPDGLIWRAKQKYGSNFRNLLYGLCVEIARLENKLNEIYDEMDVANTEAFITEWEKMIGIPSECFPRATTLEDRRKNLVFKLTASMNGTKEDFENLANELGITVKIRTGIDEISFPLTFPIPMIATAEEAAFVMIVDFIGVNQANSFPLTFPIPFSEDKTLPIRCLFDKLRPANVLIIYRYI